MDEGRRLIASFAGLKARQLRTDNRRTSTSSRQSPEAGK